jgi:hypothetical protein
MLATRLIKNCYHKHMARMKNPTLVARLGLVFYLPVFARGF